jgi:hypothetical protein
MRADQNFHPQVTSTPDEDSNDEIVKDLSILAEVKLGKHIRKPILLYTYSAVIKVK